jgi:hypothetical protein
LEATPTGKGSCLVFKYHTRVKVTNTLAYYSTESVTTVKSFGASGFKTNGAARMEKWSEIVFRQRTQMGELYQLI